MTSTRSASPPPDRSPNARTSIRVESAPAFKSCLRTLTARSSDKRRERDTLFSESDAKANNCTRKLASLLIRAAMLLSVVVASPETSDAPALNAMVYSSGTAGGVGAGGGNEATCVSTGAGAGATAGGATNAVVGAVVVEDGGGVKIDFG